MKARFPRRSFTRVVLGVFGIVCFVSFVNYVRVQYTQAGPFTDNVRRTFEWNVVEQAPKDSGCRNTVQGARLVTDDRGYTCRRENVESNNCCLPSNTTVKHSCRGCVQPSLCCNSFEYCVSCCLRPEELGYLKQLVANARSLLFTMVEDTFELCLAKCRTSSTSVVHENTYINSQYKFCIKQPTSESAIKPDLHTLNPETSPPELSATAP